MVKKCLSNFPLVVFLGWNTEIHKPALNLHKQMTPQVTSNRNFYGIFAVSCTAVRDEGNDEPLFV